MNQMNIKSINYIIGSTVIFCLLLYYIDSLCGYFTYGNQTSTNILLNYKKYFTNFKK